MDCIEEALTCLTTAAELNAGMTGTWRLIGDCCSLVAEVPQSNVKMQAGLPIYYDNFDDKFSKEFFKFEAILANCTKR